MQPQANRERIVIRTSLPPALPKIVADARSVRQIVLNLLSNSIKFTEAGGQIIVSTALDDNGNVALRVRDNGIGMSEKDIAIALEPFRQLETTIPGRAGGTGLGLPLTKALAEANRARFQIKSSPRRRHAGRSRRFRRRANSRPERDQFHSHRRDAKLDQAIEFRIDVRARDRELTGRHAFYIRGMGKESADAPAMRE